MPVSIRVITIIDQKYTVEVEVEEETIKHLKDTLMMTPWGRRVLGLMNKMLPHEPEAKDEEDVDTNPEEKTETATPSET